MTRQYMTGTIYVDDLLRVMLDLLRALAMSVLEEHTDEADLCAVCGSAWPCEYVVVATHNLAVI